MNYRLALDLEALHFLFALSPANRSNLIRWLERLKDTPFYVGPTAITDLTGREIQVSKFSHFRVFYWTDHAVKTVQVVKIELNS